MSNRLFTDPEKLGKSLFEPPSATEPSLFEKLFKCLMYAWVVWVGFILVCLGVGAYVAWHFLSKVW
jgi:hypothetical protein